MLRIAHVPFARGLVVAAALLAPPALAQDARALFHEAYYLEYEENDLEGALELYRRVAESRRVDEPTRARAQVQARGLEEELASADLARLVPAETILYAELDRPGEQVASLLEALGLLGEAGVVAPEGLAISPLLVQHALGMRGVAVAVTSMRPDGEPGGVVILDPGRHAGLRGLIDTALPAGGTPVDSIGGFPAWSVEGEAFVCLTSRLVVASRDPRQIEKVVERLSGRGGSSLSDDPRFVRAFDGGRPGLVRFYLNAEPLKPLMRMALEAQAAQDPGAAMAMGLLDIDSLESLSGRLGVDDEGIALEVALDLSEGHRNVVFDLLRRPTVGRETLELVPEGAAFFVASAFNPRAAVAPIARDSRERPVVSLLDFGREWFGNVVDAAVVGMPPDPDAGPGLPDVALVLRVNDVERSRALWDLLLGMASQAGGDKPPAREMFGDVEVARYLVQGAPVFLASRGDRLVISPNRDAVGRSLAPRTRSVTSDIVFASSLGVIDTSPTLLLAACPGRCAEMALPYAPRGEAEQITPLVDLLGETALTIAAQHSDTRLGMRVRIHEIPDVSGMVAQALAASKNGRVAGTSASAAYREAAVAVALADEAQAREASVRTAASLDKADPDELRARFEALARKGSVDGANRLADQIAATAKDAQWLNSFAWALLTEDPYQGRFDAAARSLSLRSNELSDWSSWFYLDTLALAEFRAGDVRRAIELQTKAVELAADDPRGAEAKAALKRYRAALQAGGSPIVSRGGDEGGG